MKDSELRMIETMLKKQSKLDGSIMSAYGLTEIDRENLDMAILDEIGELTHELKGEWCWWKKTQAPVDDEKVLGELVDIWHFVLSYQNHFEFGEQTLGSFAHEKEMSDMFLERLRGEYVGLHAMLVTLVEYNSPRIEVLIAITEFLNFTIEQVYDAYCEKNKINYQRLKEGY